MLIISGDQFDGDNSNIVHFVSCLKKDDPSQVTYYQSGIGTMDEKGRLSKGVSSSLDMAIGSGLGTHIMDAYRFLMANYHEGDRICLLGFSRGAYTVRCLAGMLHKVGLLPAGNRSQVPFAYSFYKNDTAEGWKMSAMFKRAFSNNVEVHFVGVYDCVASVGFIPRKLPFSKTPTNTIKYFRHAMALDERRAKFKVCQWQQENPAAAAKETTKTSHDEADQKKWKGFSGLKARLDKHNHSHDESPDLPNDDAKPALESQGLPSDNMSEEKKVDAKVGPEKKPQSFINVDALTTHTQSLQRILDSEESEKEQKKFEQDFNAGEKKTSPTKTDVLEVWFLGGHADVGGGAVKNEERHMLSRIALRWMIRQCFECNTGIIFNTYALAEIGLDLPTLWPVYQQHTQPVVGPSPKMIDWYKSGKIAPLRRRSTALGVDNEATETPKRLSGSQGQTWQDMFGPELLPEHAEDHFDAMAPMLNMLEERKAWWILEVCPVKIRVLKGPNERCRKSDEGNWKKAIRMNLGRTRAVREVEPKMHWTVQLRMNEQGYKIQNRVDKDTKWQIAY